ncbi:MULTISPECIES: protease inhibitor I42 family protein [Pseudomonas]|uniref:Inhibitor of cysteine peptidase n=1 Tax=Pseudomonas hunanensis TaxID=1247546 RepID=A0ACC6K3N7_9PSED|nr:MULTISPECIES: protease inhibitor I42 family protein [Pseudomonas]MBP2263991.1 inhibitor of cysteine peptidase [Pseudomonas sp. BP8]MDR6712981.1 inhibitor of cysteine peptidase [Pseudomonas hunanensis]HDS1734099.1 protease inhibitor I42 family protein [Pseudomonas putida]
MTALRLLVPLSLTLIAACSQRPAQTLELGTENECPIRLQTGQSLTLSLPSNPTTGYRWLLQNPASNILRPIAAEVYTQPEEAGLVGSAGVSTWRFQAKAVGDGHLILVYQQPWAPEVRPVQTFDCEIRVK